MSDGPVGQAVELYFDAVSEARLLAEWDRIGSDLAQLGARPHVSLAVFRPPTDPTPVIEAIDAWTAHEDPMEVSLESVGMFDAGVVFLAPVVSAELIAAHGRFHAFLGDLERWDLYRPGRWVPHCTMATRLGLGEQARTAARLLDGNGFGPARLERVGLVEYDPVKSLHDAALE